MSMERPSISRFAPAALRWSLAALVVASAHGTAGWVIANWQRAEAAMGYLEPYPLDAMPEDAGRLLQLLLALTQVAMAVELHRAPRVPHSTFPHGLTIDIGIQPFG